MNSKVNPLPIPIQAALIRKMYPNTEVNTHHDHCITWVHTITPSPLGDKYKIKLVYDITSSPKIYVLKPKPLALAKNSDKLPHCYDQEEQRLCLYFPDGKEWNKTMLLTKTVIPWTYEWLFHYEIWLGTGEWTGGGVHPVKNKKKNE